MNVGKIQRLSETHENLEMFLKICLLPGVKFTIHEDDDGHSKTLETIETALLLPCLRKGTRGELVRLEARIKKEVTHGS